eukprot:CAMPEP_0177647976 /NCGR_PEP_ID=MMETSP0447-20121125/10583_1 /TAXON_ID=0 /ORGANISM="Stygamoeba regulata, Strain BSH-02190019" /LENGTH=372 /DNA_ID=CAMNT_0019150589 /DNA_START=48 /DNA_END=1166 /DNA_ORIENTATION=+
MAHLKGSGYDGLRARRQQVAREKEKEEFERKRKQLEADNRRKLGDISSKFGQSSDRLEKEFKAQTYGLVSAEEFKRKREELVQQSLAEEAKKQRQAERRKQKKAKKRHKQSKLNVLSFADEMHAEDDDELGLGAKRVTADAQLQIDAGHDTPTKSAKCENTPFPTPPEITSESAVSSGAAGLGESDQRPKKKSMKNPDADTSFLPDRDRDLAIAAKREELKRQWQEKQEAMKAEAIEVTYSYWDGAGHRRTLKCTKGTSIAKFLDMVRNEFRELRGLSVDDLIYIKEDLIIPQHYTFYDLIVTKARGKSGPLFKFDVHDDVRVTSDARVETDESHAGKVCERRWYDRNKHTFPACRWEVYDPSVKREKYSVR